MARLGGADGVAWLSMFGLRQGTMRDAMSLLPAHTPETIPFYTPIRKLLFAIYYFSIFYFLFNKKARFGKASSRGRKSRRKGGKTLTLANKESCLEES